MNKKGSLSKKGPRKTLLLTNTFPKFSSIVLNTHYVLKMTLIAIQTP